MPDESVELPRIAGVYTKIRERLVPEETREETSASAEVSSIEEALGVSFERIPLKVKPQFLDLIKEMSSLVSFVLPEQGKKITKFFRKRRNEIVELILSELTKSSYVDGLYSQKTKICYVMGGVKYQDYDRDGLMKELAGVSLVSLHEAIHAYHDQKDSHGLPIGMEGIQAIKEFFESIKRKRLSPKEIKKRFEWFVVGRIFAEGIAEYGSRQTHARILDKWHEKLVMVGLDETEAGSMIDNINSRTNRPIDITEQNIQRQIKTAQDFVEGESASLASRKAKFSPKLQWKITKAFLDLNRGAYPLGFYFVNEAMRGLIEQGLSKTEAFNLLISSPPESLEDIANPKDYLVKLKTE